MRDTDVHRIYTRVDAMGGVRVIAVITAPNVRAITMDMIKIASLAFETMCELQSCALIWINC